MNPDPRHWYFRAHGELSYHRIKVIKIYFITLYTLYILYNFLIKKYIYIGEDNTIYSFLDYTSNKHNRIISWFKGGESGSESDGEDSGSEDSGSEGGATRDRGGATSGVHSEEEDEEQEWARFQNKLNKREKALEGKSKVSHSVHCPYFTDDKQEYW